MVFMCVAMISLQILVGLMHHSPVASATRIEMSDIFSTIGGQGGCPEYDIRADYHSLEDLQADMKAQLASAEKSLAEASASLQENERLRKQALRAARVELPYLGDKTLLHWLGETNAFMRGFDVVARQVGHGESRVVVPAFPAQEIDRVDAEDNADPRVRVAMTLSLFRADNYLKKELVSTSAGTELDLAFNPSSYPSEDGLFSADSKDVVSKMASGLVDQFFQKFPRVGGPKSTWDMLQHDAAAKCGLLNLNSGLFNDRAECAEAAKNACHTLARHFDAVMLMLFMAWADVILKARKPRTTEFQEELSREALQFIFQVAIPIFEPHLSELSKPGSFCATRLADPETQNPFALRAHEDGGNTKTVWQDEVSALMIRMLAKLPAWDAKQRNLKEAQMRKRAADLALAWAQHGNTAVKVVSDIAQDNVADSPAEAEYVYVRTVETGWKGGRRNLGEFESSELASLLGQFPTSRLKDLQNVCSRMPGGCLSVTGKCLNEQTRQKVKKSMRTNKGDRTEPSGILARLRRGHAIWENCGGSRILLFGVHGFAEIVPPTKPTASLFRLVRYVPYASILSTSLAIYTKTNGRRNNRVYIAFRVPNSGLELPPMFWPYASVFYVDSEATQKSWQFGGDQLLFQPSGSHDWNAETARNVAVFLTSKAQWCE